MSKTVTLILVILAIALIAFNATMINFQDPFGDDSLVAWIGIIAPLCAIILLLINQGSKKISDKLK
ncbi:MAG: hypothetical protein ED555_03285 [Allomuricauda sp.]|nr:MAG: hypothetical protein ED555_03285 [Allomuricauda sp.]